MSCLHCIDEIPPELLGDPVVCVKILLLFFRLRLVVNFNWFQVSMIVALSQS